MRLAIDQLPAVVWATDRELRITSSVGAGLAAVGLKPNGQAGLALDEALGTSDPEFPPPAARCALRGEWSNLTFHAHIAPLRDFAGEIAGSLGVAIDVTERRRADEAPRISQARVEGIVAISEDATISIDNGQRIHAV